MGGVTDGQTVIRSLKSVFSGNSKGKGKSFIFVLYTTITPIILLILAGLIFWQRMTKEHINCYAPPDEDVRADAVNQYCFVTGTYTIIGSSNNLKNSKKTLPYPGVGPRISDSGSNGGGTEVKYHMYFQWVPFVMLVQAILFTIPNFVWKSLRKDTLSRYSNSIMSEDKQGQKTQRQTSIRFQRNLKHHSSYWGWFITSEVLNLAVVILAFSLSDLLLTGQFTYFGRDWVRFLRMDNTDEVGTGGNSSASPLDEVFPKMSKCEFKKFGPGGGIINYDLLCVMTLNVFHDKVFLFLWFWFMLLVVIQLLSLFYQLVILRFRDFQCKLILGRIEPAFVDDDEENYNFIELDPGFKQNAKAFLRSLGFSDWFLLKAISSSVDSEMFTKFFQSLVLVDLNAKRKRYSVYPVANENEYVDTGRYRNVSENNRGRGLEGGKKHGTSENLANPPGYQKERKDSGQFTRNRAETQGQTLYSALNASLREIEAEESEDRVSLIGLKHNKHELGNEIPMIQLHTQSGHRKTDIPDGPGYSGHEYNNIPSSFDRKEKSREDLTDT